MMDPNSAGKIFAAGKRLEASREKSEQKSLLKIGLVLCGVALLPFLIWLMAKGMFWSAKH